MPSRTKQPLRAAPARAAVPARRVRQAPVRPARPAVVRPARNGAPPVAGRSAARHATARPASRTITARRVTARPATRTAARRPTPRPVRQTVAPPERQAPQASRRVREVARAPEEQPQTCVHEWVIEPPNGPTSQGKCRRCGEVRAFRNSLDITYWDTQRHGAGAAQRRKPAATPAPMPARRA